MSEHNTPDMPDKGRLQIQVTSEVTALPISDAVVKISYTGMPDSQLEELRTDSSGQTETIELETPPLEYSLNPAIESQPYSEYTLQIDAPGYEPVSIAGAELLPTVTAVQNLALRPSDSGQSSEEVFVIPAHTLYGVYPPKIPEEEIKPVSETGEIVLSRVVVPEYIVVHDGSPRDTTARNYYVKYKDYIKNVASSEIYATWPEDTIRANVLAIMSFTLNRVYTEWYRNKGYDFTITSSTAFDHKWIPERNIYNTISVIVDELFADFLSRPNVRQPILTQYCDGRQVQCPNWMTFLQGRIKIFRCLSGTIIRPLFLFHRATFVKHILFTADLKRLILSHLTIILQIIMSYPMILHHRSNRLTILIRIKIIPIPFNKIPTHNHRPFRCSIFSSWSTIIGIFSTIIDKTYLHRTVWMLFSRYVRSGEIIPTTANQLPSSQHVSIAVHVIPLIIDFLPSR